jgi:glutamate-1-semialdehyde 2,1-aminomutase
MKDSVKKNLLHDLIQSYIKKHPKSEDTFKKAGRFQVRGGSHTLRLFEPFPFYDVHCKGAKVRDMDGNTYVDFWQGHFANILGHNPDIVLTALSEYFKQGQGLETGFPGEWQRELADLLLQRIRADKIRFTTSGALASMYAIMLAKAFTQRDMVLKVGGGWHGAQPYALKGITAYRAGLNMIESAGLSAEIDSKIAVTKFNDIEDLEFQFKTNGEKIACFLIEPFIGSGGFIFGDRDYIQKSRELADRYGSVLIFDEVVSGFRFFAGGIQSLYGVNPDLSIFGKAIGGGMPVSAVSGREDILSLCSSEVPAGKRVKFEGGTFSAHPACMLAGLTYIRYLIENEDSVYPRIGKLANYARKEIEKIFDAHNFSVKCTGEGESVTENSSLIGVHFLREYREKINSPEQVWNPDICHIDLREKIFKLAMLEEGFNIFHGFGAVSEAHSEEDLQSSLDAVERIAKKWDRLR